MPWRLISWAQAEPYCYLSSFLQHILFVPSGLSSLIWTLQLYLVKNVNYWAIVRFEVSTVVTMMIIIFWEMTPCGDSYESVPIQELTTLLCNLLALLKMEAIRSSETSVLIRATRCHYPEDDNQYWAIHYAFFSTVTSPFLGTKFSSVPCPQTLHVYFLPSGW
jgi:hypothetical protein